MANSIPGSYKQISFIKNSTAETQKLLKAVFLLGPSKAVLSNGGVIVSKVKIDQDVEDDQSENKDNETQTDESSEDSSNESYNYTILEALSFLRYNKVYEDDDSSKEDSAKNSEESPKEDDGDEEKSDTKNDIDDQNKEDTDHEFSDTDLEVIVNLPNEGCTKWHIRLNNITDEDKVIAALKSKKFKAAYDIANAQAASVVEEGQSAEGITILSATTMLDKKREQFAPFIGKCRWAFDVGTDDNNAESLDLEIAIAPIDGKSKKPMERTVYHTVFNIVGDITNGSLEGFDTLDKIKEFMAGDEDSDRDNDASEVLHKWLQSNFRCVGDSSMYDDFLKVRTFIDNNLKKKTIEFSKNDSSSIANYIPVIKSAKSFISF